jgi:LPS O-antigen subunit length determinant protein (WzzB/FepE family)
VVRSNSSKAIEKLSSLSFFENNIMPNIYLPDLIAVKSWSALENSITYDEKIFNQSKNEWIRSYKYFGKAPSAQTSFSAFKLNHFSVSEDRETGFVTIKIKHQSPYIAKTWGEILVNEINSFYREKDRDDAQKAVDYLSEQILNINLADIKQVVAVLLQQEIQKLTLIEVNESYVYEYIDPPALMESKVGPNRLLIIIQAIIFGFILGSLLVLVKHYFKKELD